MIIKATLLQLGLLPCQVHDRRRVEKKSICIFCLRVSYNSPVPAIFLLTPLYLRHDVSDRLADGSCQLLPAGPHLQHSSSEHQNLPLSRFYRGNPSNVTVWGRWQWRGIVLYCDRINNLMKTWSSPRVILAIFQVRYTGYRDRPIHERQNKFLNAARDGSTEIVSTIFIILTIKIELKSPVTSPPDFSNKLL